VTLGYLGATQIGIGSVEEACATWGNVLEAMEECIYSGRARQAIVDMRNLVSPYRRRGILAVAELDARAAAHLGRSPRNDPKWPTTGTFVHRNHRRPNLLAESFPRLLKVEGLDLHVTDLDAIDGSPVFDLAPYFKEMGPRGEVREPSWPREMLRDYWDDPQS
jgi:hypothetical protein